MSRMVSVKEAKDILKKKGITNYDSISTVHLFFKNECNKTPGKPNKPLPCERKDNFDKLIKNYLAKEKKCS